MLRAMGIRARIQTDYRKGLEGAPVFWLRRADRSVHLLADSAWRSPAAFPHRYPDRNRSAGRPIAERLGVHRYAAGARKLNCKSFS